MEAAQRVEVLRGGRSALGEGDSMVEIAAPRGLPASGEAADPISQDDLLHQGAAGAVHIGTDGQVRAGRRTAGGTRIGVGAGDAAKADPGSTG